MIFTLSAFLRFLYKWFCNVLQKTLNRSRQYGTTQYVMIQKGTKTYNTFFYHNMFLGKSIRALFFVSYVSQDIRDRVKHCPVPFQEPEPGMLKSIRFRFAYRRTIALRVFGYPKWNWNRNLAKMSECWTLIRGTAREYCIEREPEPELGNRSQNRNRAYKMTYPS